MQPYIAALGASEGLTLKKTSPVAFHPSSAKQCLIERVGSPKAKC